MKRTTLKQKTTHTLKRHKPSIYLQSCNTSKDRVRRECFSDKALLTQKKLDFISIQVSMGIYSLVFVHLKLFHLLYPPRQQNTKTFA